MDISQKILSDIVVFNKYARHLPKEDRRETWEEIVERNKKMHLKKFPEMKEELDGVYKLVLDKKILPSMRSLQFAGPASELNPARLYNCSFMIVNDYRVFQEAMYLLLSGTGVGYSVQKHHVAQLPEIHKPSSKRTRRYVIGDSITGWADAIKMLMKSYFGLSKSKIEFDYRDIRPKGALLVTSGGKAPGPQPLKESITKIQGLLDNKEDGSKLTTLEAHTIMCHIADAVLAGGIRRAALIALFSLDDKDMIACKTGNWWEKHPERGRANNSAVVVRSLVKKDDFDKLWDYMQASGTGEPGIVFTNNPEMGVNPCCFTGETEILTSEGYKEIKDCIGDNIFINKDGELVDGIVWSNGVKDVIELYLSNKVKIKCTPDHLLMDSTGNNVIAEKTQGLRLMPYYHINQEISEFTKYGFIQGDGGLGRLDSNTHKGLEVNIGEKDGDIFELFDIKKEENKCSYYINGYNEILKALKFDSNHLPNRDFPKAFIYWDEKDQLMFLKGMYSANGSIIKNQRIAYKTTSKSLALNLSDILKKFSIDNYITVNKEKEVQFSNGNYTCKESYDVNISKYNGILKFASLIGFVHTYKQKALEELILSKAPKVLSVKTLSEKEEVFDFSLNDNKHWGVIEGIIAHNCEISLKDMQFCNLTEINVSELESEEDFYDRIWGATFLGTLQASYTDFHYLRDEWKDNCEKDALLGVSLTGIASNDVFKYDLNRAAEYVKEINEYVSDTIGINKAARTTCVKPSGTASIVLGTSSGIHAWHDKYYWRRMRVNKSEAIYTYLLINHPELLEDEYFDPEHTAIIKVPQKAPDNAITRDESAMDLLTRIKKVSTEWVHGGYRKGYNQHNVSATVTIKPHEWDEVREWMWENRENYTGLSILPYSEHTYKQPPFETCTKEEYEEVMKILSEVDLSKVVEINDNTTLQSELACSGGNCEIQ